VSVVAVFKPWNLVLQWCYCYRPCKLKYHISSSTFFKENHDQILPAHYTWKVPDKFFFSAKNLVQLMVCNILICTLYSIKYNTCLVQKHNYLSLAFVTNKKSVYNIDAWMVMKQDRKIGAIMRKAIDEKRSLTKCQFHKKLFSPKLTQRLRQLFFQPSLIFAVEIRVWIHETFLNVCLQKLFKK